MFRIDPTGSVTTLHAFANSDGAFPYGALVQGTDGLFYGTTLQGGTGTYGTVYRMDATGAVTSLHAFTWNDGAYPYASLIEGSDLDLEVTEPTGAKPLESRPARRPPASRRTSSPRQPTT